MASAYIELARALHERVTVFGLQAVGIETDVAPDQTVEAMAARYIDAIRQRDRVGPYALLGWSGGGAVALEMAARLSDAGDEVDALVLLDPAAPGHYEESTDEVEVMSELLGELRIGAMEQLRDLLASMPEHRRLEHLLDGARKRGVALVDIEDARRYVRVHRAHVEARRKYRGRPVSCPVTILQPAEAPIRSGGASLVEWQRLASGRFEVATVEGPHSSMVREPGVRGWRASWLRHSRPGSDSEHP